MDYYQAGKANQTAKNLRDFAEKQFYNEDTSGINRIMRDAAEQIDFMAQVIENLLGMKKLDDYRKGPNLELELLLKDAEELGIDIPKFVFINHHKNEWDIWQKGIKKNCNSVEIQGDETVKVTLGYTGD